MMTHRPSLLAAANKALVMKNGRVAQFGDSEDVLQMVRPSSAQGAGQSQGVSARAKTPAPGVKAGPSGIPTAQRAVKTITTAPPQSEPDLAQIEHDLAQEPSLTTPERQAG